jgi:sulfide:quinone oxidoreductase
VTFRGPMSAGHVEQVIAGVITSVTAAAFEGFLRFENHEVIPADAVIALPRLTGPRISGLPHDENGFLPVDAYGHVNGCADILAAGDATDLPIKHGSLAAQQADAVAETIAARLGAIVMPEPFRPVLRGLLLTGQRPLYLRVELGEGGTRTHRMLPAAGTTSQNALSWPPGKVTGRYLTPFLAGGGAPLQDRAAG